jgi:hypothetical protein
MAFLCRGIRSGQKRDRVPPRSVEAAHRDVDAVASEHQGHLRRLHDPHGIGHIRQPSRPQRHGREPDLLVAASFRADARPRKHAPVLEEIDDEVAVAVDERVLEECLELFRGCRSGIHHDRHATAGNVPRKYQLCGIV